MPGEKSNDKDSPAYVPLLFSFTDSPAKGKAEYSMERWRAVKRRCLQTESSAERPSAEEPSPDEQSMCGGKRGSSITSMLNWYDNVRLGDRK